METRMETRMTKVDEFVGMVEKILGDNERRRENHCVLEEYKDLHDDPRIDHGDKGSDITQGRMETRIETRMTKSGRVCRGEHGRG